MRKGENYLGFALKDVYKLSEIGVELYHFEHEKTGAEVVHIKADDEENVFALTFKTYPYDSTGVAHILEHTTLCGSKNYPIHDPFFSMLRRSSNTYMNALTAKLWTAYPAASKIKNDFYNLLDIYLDSTFFPLLNKTSFQQEGYRFTFEDPFEPKTPLTIQGIVFNEMKGVFSNPESVLWRKLAAGLCPDTPYGHDSGGDPKEIPNLTHENLKKFHDTYYHPSRCIFYFYGNIPVEEHLSYIEKKVLANAEKKEAIAPIPKQKRFHEPKRDEAFYPSQDEDTKQKTFVGFSWLTTNIKDQDELLAFTLLDSILMDTDASLLKLKLLSSGLMVDVGSVIDSEAQDTPYAIIVRGADKENVHLIEEFLFKSLEEIAKGEIPKELIDSSLHQLKFGRSEISSDSGPYGLELFGRSVIPYLQGGSLVDELKVHSAFDHLEKLVYEDKILPKLIEKYLLKNKHFYRLTLAPSSTLLKKMNEDELTFLKEKKEHLTKAEIVQILSDAKALDDYIEAKEVEDTSCLPMLSLDEIPSKASYFPLKKETLNQLALYHHDCFTNGIIYADLVYDLPQIDEEDLFYLRLFSSVLTDLGAGGRSYVENLKFIHAKVGGIWTSLSLNVQKGNNETCYPTISISGKALFENTESLFKLMKDFIISADFKDRERIKELIMQSYTYLAQKLNSHAIQYALRESASGFSTWSHVSNVLHGLPYFKFMERISKNLENELDEIERRFEKLAKQIFHLNNPHCVISCDEEAYRTLQKHSFYDLKSFSDASESFCPWVELAKPQKVENSLKAIAYPIAHNAMSLETVTMSSRYAACLKLASYLFENLELHKQIREVGGAYHTGAKYNILTGTFQFFSSRDPNISSSYKAFQTAVEQICEGSFSEEDLLEAKLSYIQDVDGVVPPGSRASITYFQHKVGLTLDVRQKFRDQILSASKAEVMQAVKECLIPKITTESVRITYASEDLIKKEHILLKENNLPDMQLKQF
jgi:Zn-dependent M16 (insulinase) family peptidase